MTIFEKIKAVQNKLSVKKDGTNPFFKSKYITLDEIMDKLQPLLNEQNLMVYNYNLKDGGVRTLVVDLDGNETIGSDFIIPGLVDPQALAKVLTYGRRYNLVSIFNIIADEDDDAQSFYDEKGVAKKKYDKRIFGMKEFENLKMKKDMFTYEEAMEMIKNNYSIDTEMEIKVDELYGIEAADLFK